ncbi:MAG: 7-cyano-7-deazaguanine synthase, partial [Nitrososphaerales archaeon]
MITEGEDRGRDSYGIVTFSEGKEPIVFKRLGKPSSTLNEWDGHFSSSTTIVINNNRAEPTPEFISHKTEQDIQPFGDNIVITHNGVVANDLELAAKYRLDCSSKIDSAVIPPLLESSWDGSVQNLKQILLEDLVGSYALGVVDSRRPTDLFLACNYKPLFIEYDRKNEALFFSSLDDYFRNTSFFDSNPIREISPYSLLRIDIEKNLEEVSLW